MAKQAADLEFWEPGLSTQGLEGLTGKQRLSESQLRGELSQCLCCLSNPVFVSLREVSTARLSRAFQS
jgi:hypothetical protein